MNLEPEELIFYPNKIKIFILLSICSFFIWISIFKADKNIDWFGTIFWGVGFAVFAASLFPNSNYLKLTKDGLIVNTLYRKHFHKWEDVKDFDVVNLNLSKTIVFKYTSNYMQQKKIRSLLSFLKGFEGAFPDNYGKNPYELAKILNEWKLKFSKSYNS